MQVQCLHLSWPCSLLVGTTSPEASQIVERRKSLCCGTPTNLCNQPNALALPAQCEWYVLQHMQISLHRVQNMLLTARWTERKGNSLEGDRARGGVQGFRSQCSSQRRERTCEGVPVVSVCKLARLGGNESQQWSMHNMHGRGSPAACRHKRRMSIPTPLNGASVVNIMVLHFSYRN
eukprot:365966-Chlamydomonas_euryale.AAC.4